MRVSSRIDFLDKDIDNKHQISFTLQDDTKKADETIPNHSFASSVDFRRDIVDEVDFVNKDIDN